MGTKGLKLFGYKDYLEKVDIEWVAQFLGSWVRHAEEFKEDFFGKFNQYKRMYFDENGESQSGEGGVLGLVLM